ncbi:MAG: hypothetical protein ACR2NT_12075 [Acidimicrobiia bacterium]
MRASRWRLAAFEGHRLLTHPLNLAGAAISIAVFLLTTWDSAPVFDRDVITLVGCCLALTATALLTAESVASRDDIYEAVEMVDSKPMDRDHRLIGLSLALWAPVLLALVVVCCGLLWFATDSPAGSTPWLELAGAPAMVAFGHVGGVAVGRWLRFPLAGTITVLVIGGIYVLERACIGCSGILPLPSPFLPWHASVYDLPQTAGRLAPVHLAYVLGFATLLAGVASRRWRIALVATVVAAGAVVGLTGTPDDAETIVARADAWATTAPLICETRDVVYCALPGFEGWIEHWDEVVDGVGAVVPEPLPIAEIRQGFDIFDAPSSAVTVWVGTRWTRTGHPSSVAGDLAASLAAPTLGLPTSVQEAHALQPDLPACMRQSSVSLIGEARAPTSVLVTALATPSTGSYVRTRIRESEFEEQFGRVVVSAGELDLVDAILDHPRSDVTAVLNDRWSDLLDPNTSSSQLAAWFGEPPPERAEPQFQLNPEHCECNPGGGVSCSSR